MNRVTKYFRLIGFAAILGLSNTAYAECGFTTGTGSPDGVTDLSGQGNFACEDFIGSDGMPMREETDVTFYTSGDWILTDPELDFANTPDHIVLFPRGNGSRCDFSYFRDNAVEGSGLLIGSNVNTKDSIACTDDEINDTSQEIDLGEPDIVTIGDGCNVTLKEFFDTDDENDITDQFDFFTGGNLEGTKQTICSADGTEQYECVRGCPEFIDIDALQEGGVCTANEDGTTPLFDGTQRCTPCLTAAQAKATIPGFDTGVGPLPDEEPIKLCWEYVNRVGILSDLGELAYKPHKSIRSQTSQTELYNECYTTTTTINFFGREITKTFTTCD
jgi:hypothetical protein